MIILKFSSLIDSLFLLRIIPVSDMTLLAGVEVAWIDKYFLASLAMLALLWDTMKGLCKGFIHRLGVNPPYSALLSRTPPYSALLGRTLLHSAALRCTLLHPAALRCALPHSATLCRTPLHPAALHPTFNFNKTRKYMRLVEIRLHCSIFMNNF